MLTELTLTLWRLGQVVAERLCAGILRFSGYTDIEPQAPSGRSGREEGRRRTAARQEVRRGRLLPNDGEFLRCDQKEVQGRISVALRRTVLMDATSW